MPAPEGNQYALGNDGGRPSSYEPKMAELAAKLSQKGFTDAEMADVFDISVRTFYRWMVDHEEFCHAVKLGKDAPDDRVERSLFHRATGFEWKEQQAFKLKEVTWVDGQKQEIERVEVVSLKKQAPPDTAAGIFWLKNRRKEQWRDRHDHTMSGPDGGPIQYSELSDEELRRAANPATLSAG